MLEQPMCPKQEKSRSEHSARDWLEVAAVSQSASVDRLEPVDVTSSETFFFAAWSSPAIKTCTGAARP
jgi:hypothetical protein